MREPQPHETPVFGLLAEFGDAEELVNGARQARSAGFQRLDAYSPFRSRASPRRSVTTTTGCLG